MLVKKKHLIVDTDPGIDDAMALSLALFTRSFKIDLITTAAGNLGIDVVTANALNLVNYFGVNVPVAKGAAQPLEVKAIMAPGVHGGGGFGGVEFARHSLTPLIKPAHDAMFDVLKKNGKKGTTIVVLSPATNIALLLKTYPQCKEMIQEIVFMGTSLEGINNDGDIYKQFNLENDPHAAKIMLESGIKTTIIPTELGHYAFISNKEIEKTAQTSEAGKMLAAMYKNYRDRHVKQHAGVATHDACAMAYLFNSKLVRLSPCQVKIALDEKCRGRTKISLRSEPGTVQIALKIDIPDFKKYYFKTLKKMKKA